MFRIRHFLYPLLTFILLFTLSSCQFGNFSENSDGNGDGQATPDLVGDEYHRTAAESVEFCVTLTGAQDPRCVQVAANQAPYPFSAIITNPTRFVWHKQTGEAIIASSDGQGQLGATVDLNTMAFSGDAEYEPYYFWREMPDSCVSYESYDWSGQVHEGAASGEEAGFPVSGRIHVDINANISHKGICDDQLQEMEDCFLNEEDCPVDPQFTKAVLYQATTNWFGIWVSAGALEPSEISEIASMSYKLSYR